MSRDYATMVTITLNQSAHEHQIIQPAPHIAHYDVIPSIEYSLKDANFTGFWFVSRVDYRNQCVKNKVQICFSILMSPHVFTVRSNYLSSVLLR